MTEGLDKRIARVSAELNKLRERKLEWLRREMLRMEGAADAAPSTRRKRRKLTDEEVRALLEKAVGEAGDKGISAAKAAESTSISYNRVRLLMPRLFKKTGSVGSTLYVLKPRRGRGPNPPAGAPQAVTESSPSEEPAQ